MRRHTAFGFVAALSGFALSSAALADAPLSSSNLFDYEARAGVSYSDNVTRTPGRDYNSVAAVLGGRLQARRPEGRLRYDAAGDLSYYRYLKSAVGGQLFGGIKGNAIYDILADSVSWGAQASYNQIKQDLQRPVALGNLEDVISLSTGPTFRVRLGSTLEASLEGRFALTDFSKRSFDNQTVGGKFVVAKRLSPISLIGLGGSADRLSYSKQIGLGSKDFDRREVFVRYGTEFIRTRISFDAGSSTLKGGNVDESNPVVRANVAHRISPSLSFFGDYAQEFAASDAGIYVPPLATGPATGAITSILTGGPRTIKSYRGGMIFKRPRTTVEIGLSRYDEASLGPLPLTRATDEFLAKATRLITPRSHGTAYGKYSDDKSSTQLFQSKGYQVGIEYGLLFDKLLGINCRVEHAQRTSPTLSSNYTETSIGLFVTYGRAISADRQ